MTKTRTRKPAEVRKAEIVDTAIRLSAELGPDRLTTDRLAREIGISQAAIFRHFPTKGDIWLAVGQRIATLMRSDTALGSDVAEPPAEQLRNLVVRQLTYFEKTPAIPAILFSRELHAENEDLRLHFASMMQNRMAMFAGLIESEKSNGDFSKDLDSTDAAALVLALIQGLAMRWSLFAREFDLVEEGKRLLEIQIRGFLR